MTGRDCLQATSQDARQAAEKFLTQFKQMPNPYVACFFVLANSSNPHALFQAASAIKDAA